MPILRSLILPNTYRDSVFLMKLSSQAKEETGAIAVSAMMGTPRNKALFVESGLSTDEAQAANPDDLVIVVKAEEPQIDGILAAVKKLLDSANTRKKEAGSGKIIPATIAEAVKEEAGLNLALISVAGDYARLEAARALHAGMDVMLYSDNISIQDERALKELAHKKGRLVMGPDCGTAIINGVPLAFANTTRRGSVGIVGASGTGLQEVVCLLERAGVGVSHAYGVGGRDLKDEMGAITALDALERLLQDEGTKTIGILGKPPGKATRQKIIERIKAAKKPVSVHFLGAANYAGEEAAGIAYAKNLTDFGLLLARQVNPKLDEAQVLGKKAVLPQGKPKQAGFLRGLFSGGTLCQESAELLRPILGKDLYANLSISGYEFLKATDKSKGHAFWDFGDDAFTVGRPHPMMAPELRMERLIEELSDPAVSVVLMDIVIGYGAAIGQAQTLIDALKKAEKQTGGKSLEKCVILSVCGTDLDAPSRKDEIARLEKHGVIVGQTNAKAAQLAASAATQKGA